MNKDVYKIIQDFQNISDAFQKGNLSILKYDFDNYGALNVQLCRILYKNYIF